MPNSIETIRTTSTGSGIVSIFSTFVGKEILTTEGAACSLVSWSSSGDDGVEAAADFPTVSLLLISLFTSLIGHFDAE